jgi:hypothetical protein
LVDYDKHIYDKKPNERDIKKILMQKRGSDYSF